METISIAAAFQVLVWLWTLLQISFVASLLFLFLAVVRAVIDARSGDHPITRRHSVLPDHPVPFFPPYQGL